MGPPMAPAGYGSKADAGGGWDGGVSGVRTVPFGLGEENG